MKIQDVDFSDVKRQLNKMIKQAMEDKKIVRNKEYILPVLAQIQEYWEQHPALRLSQLILGAGNYYK